MQPPLPIPPDLLTERGAGLHIGGEVRKPGWAVLNAKSGPHVDHVGDIRDLSRFGAGAFDMVYASHVLEHVGHDDAAKLLPALLRILRPQGRLFVSVPDLRAICYLFAHEQVTEQERLHLVRILYGGQVDEHDYHLTGFWDVQLISMLAHAGFGMVYRVPGFGLFADTSDLKAGDIPLCLNIVAVK